MNPTYHGFLPQHTASTHRVFAIVDHGKGETVEALATFPTAERADIIADMLNLLTVEHPPELTRDRLLAALAVEPGPVRASVTSVLDALRPSRLALAVRLRRRITAGIASFPVSGCPSGGCSTCTTCGDGCLDCPACESSECDACLMPVITPRTALLLHAAAEILSDELSGVIGDPEILADFPPFVQHLNPAAVDLFGTAFLNLATDLAHGQEPQPRTSAEEVALHLMTDRANALLETDTFEDEVTQLPESSADYDWDGILDVMFEDDDYAGLMAYRGKLPAKEVASLFERFDSMPKRPYATAS
ncbi:hypothetical protein [Micromonospora sp. NPDC001898]|uniref:4Fe-4S ferredoxin-type domain-containing protein n=1 Tax=Micromonospora rubida TaxID=2697657 RepID=A0ABW7SW67_9ACTN